MDNSDLFNLLHGFERNTWASLDHLANKISENNEIISNISSIQSSIHNNCRNDPEIIVSTSSPPHSTNSALTEAISMGLINDIYDKCDEIEEKCIQIDQKVNILTENAVLDIMNNENSSTDQTDSGYSQSSTPIYSPTSLSPTPNLSELAPTSLSVTPNLAELAFNLAPSTPRVISSMESSAILPFEYHASNFSTNISQLDILNYLIEKTGYNPDQIRVIRLTKKDQDLSLLSFVNFKIETTEEIGLIISEPGFWPKSCKITPFVRKNHHSKTLKHTQKSPVHLSSLSRDVSSVDSNNMGSNFPLSGTTNNSP